MQRIDLELLRNAIDMHVHTAPDLFQRPVDDITLARDALRAGMRAVVLKCHFSMTTFRAYLVKEVVGEGIQVCGSLVMNQTFGGLNPYAVDVAIKSGAKIIWMPTNSAKNHIRFYRSGNNVAQKMVHEPLYPIGEGISPLDAGGNVVPQMKETLRLIANSDVVFATGHCSTQETRALVREAFRFGVKKIIITHPDSEVVNMPIRDQKELAEMGAYVERTILPITPSWKSMEVRDLIERIRAVPIERTIMTTDLGQMNNPSPVEGYRMFIQILLDNGIPPDEIRTMTCRNPARLLGLPPLER